MVSKETLSVLNSIVHLSTLCYRRRNYLYLPRLFTTQAFLERQSKKRVANTSTCKINRNARDP